MATPVLPNQVLPDSEMVDSGRYEFVHGRLIERAMPGLKHAALRQRMVDLLRPQVALTGKVVMAELSLDQNERARSEWLTPDVLVSTGQGFATKSINDHALAPAFLAIEILSPGQTFINLRWKADHYIQWGVQDVWFLDPESASVLTYAAPDSSRGQMLSSGTVAVEEELSVALSEIFV